MVCQCSGTHLLSESAMFSGSEPNARKSEVNRKKTMTKMKAVQVPKAGAEFEIVEREIPQPGPGNVRIRVQACGICHSDVITKEGLFPGIIYPRVPGHEVAGVIDEVSAGVKEWQKGQAGWSRLARRTGRHLSCLPSRRLRELREREGLRHQLRRWLSGIHDRACRGVGADAGIARRG